MKHASQCGIIGMAGGAIIGWIALARSMGSGDLLEGNIVIFMGALFIGLVIGIFTFLLGLVVCGKD